MVCVVLPSEIVVDLQEALHQVAGVDVGAGGVLRDRRHDSLQEGVVDLDARLGERFRELTALDLARRLVARRVACEHGDRRVEVLIVTQREERDPGRGILNGEARAGERGKAHIAHPHTCGRRRPASRETRRIPAPP